MDSLAHARIEIWKKIKVIVFLTSIPWAFFLIKDAILHLFLWQILNVIFNIIEIWSGFYLK